MAIIRLCLLAGCLLMGIMIAEVSREYPYIKPTIPGGVTGEEKEEAIRIALSNESVKEKIEGLEYEVRDALAFEKWMTGRSLILMMFIYTSTGLQYAILNRITRIVLMPSKWRKPQK